jgi:zinc protease
MSISRKFLLVTIVLLCSPVHAAIQIQNWNLPNGARVLFVENHSIPILDLSIEFDAGSRRDPPGKTGTAGLTNSMLALGVREERLPNGATEPALTEAQISDAFADTAAQRGGSAGADRAGASLRTLSSPAERDAAVALLSRILAQPAFPENFLARDKARIISSIKEDLTKPQSIASRAFWRLMYRTHPYATEETVESVGAITRDDLVAFHAVHYVSNHAVIAIVGDTTRAGADAIARELTARLPQGAPLPALPPVPPAAGLEERVAHPATQSHIMLGEPSVVRLDPENFPLAVGNYVLGGGGFVSRLTRQVREQRGLAYSVYSYFSPMLQEGPFVIGLQTKKEQTDEALKVVRDTLAEFLRDGPTEAELKAAKDNLIGGFPLRIDNNRKILAGVASIGFYNLPLDYLDTWTAKIAKVTAAEVKQAFNRRVAADKLTTVVVGADKVSQTANQKADRP